MTIASIMGCASPTNKRKKNDAYATPATCTRALARVEAIHWPKKIWEPCAGRGDLSAVLRDKGFAPIETDLAQRVDFLNAKRAVRLIDEIGYPIRIWALTERPDFLGQGAPTMNCSWYVWSNRH